jgi:transcriptional regulator with XRE-family HTH domain
MCPSRKTHARLRLVTSDGVLVDGYKSGRRSHRDTPDNCSSDKTRSAGTPPRRHLSTAWGEMPNALANAPGPPEALIARSTGLRSMDCSQPQVEVPVNLRLVAGLNLRFHPSRMSPLGKIITRELNRMGETQAWLAEEVGVSENAVSKWIATGKISRENAKKVSPIIDVSLDQLLNPIEGNDPDSEWRSFPPAFKVKLIALAKLIRGSEAEVPQTRQKQKMK